MFSLIQAYFFLTQDAVNRRKLVNLRGVLESQMNMDWPEIKDTYGDLVSSEALLPYAR